MCSCMLEPSILFGDGCVLQQGGETRVWGTGSPGMEVVVELQSQTRRAKAGASGRWEVYLCNLTPGGPFRMKIENDAGEMRIISDVYVGEVWICSGQSNMQLTMQRVKDCYPKEMIKKNSWIRHFKVAEHYDFSHTLTDCAAGEWKESHPDNTGEFSALCYFFGQYLQKVREVPVGLINVSVGGSRIEAWMSMESLNGYEDILTEARQLADVDAVQKFLQNQDDSMNQWLSQAAASTGGQPESDWKNIQIPGYLSDAGLSDFCGSIWLRRNFTVPEAMWGQPANLWLGTMTDSDRTYINGTFTGETGYQYPPRKYTVPAGVLRKGENNICIHLICNDGRGRVTPGKDLCIFLGTERVDLSGSWEYRIHKTMKKAPEMDFLCRKAGGLYQGMLAPCQKYTVRGVLWYQGESNDKAPGDYEELLKRMILSWRKSWNQKKLPFVVVQLPGFSIDLPEENSGWPEIREAQSKAAEAIPDTEVTVNLDLGEDNDLHPSDKKEVAFRAVQAARCMVYGENITFKGPVPRSWSCDKAEVKITFDVGDDGILMTKDGQNPGEFCLAGKDMRFYPAVCELYGNQAVLKSEAVREAVSVRYAWGNAPRQGLICNKSGILAAPFRLDKRSFGRGEGNGETSL